MTSPLRWLGVSAGLALLAALLFAAAPHLSRPVEVTVCNQMAAQAVEQVEVQLMPAEPSAPLTQLGPLPAGECRTAHLPVRGEASVRLMYRVQGVQFTVSDPALGYVEGGYGTVTQVQGVGSTASAMEPLVQADARVLVLVLVLMASISGALAAFLCAAWSGLRSLLAAASRAGPPP